MKHLHPLTPALSTQAAALDEFANGGAQCHAELQDGQIHSGLLISNSTAIIAMRGYETLPFKVEAIARLFQTEEDKNPPKRAGWVFFDKWTTDANNKRYSRGKL
jgi:hypothetical protein